MLTKKMPKSSRENYDDVMSTHHEEDVSSLTRENILLTEKSPKSSRENCDDVMSTRHEEDASSLTRENILLTEKYQKSRPEYLCSTCDYNTSKKTNYSKHLLTLKHILLTEKSQKYQKSSSELNCSICHYTTSKKSNYEKHLLTRKHMVLLKKSQNNDNEENTRHVCNNCMAIYHSKQGLWNHKQKCKEVPTPAPQQPPDLAQMFMTMVKQNNEFKELILEQNEKDQELKTAIIELSKRENMVIHNTNNTNSNNTNHFNINLFLNEKCKDALNITDFVNSLTIDFEDLEYVGNNGYVDGITNLFVKGLKELDIYKRPIHCTDVKRETLYIKDDDVWEKDTHVNSKIKKVIGKIANKNIMKISSWQHAHPECSVLDSSAYNLHMRIMKQSLNGGPPEQSDRNDSKILKNIARIVYIDKKAELIE